MLKHLRVIDLSSHLGAFAGRMLAELGAEVIKVESSTGDPQRQDSASFSAWNHGKRSVVTETTSDDFKQLISSADIVIRNPGLDHEHLMSINPALIDVVLAAFLPTGINAKRNASDLTLMARSGLMTIIGDPDRPPLTLPGEQAYALGAIQAVTGALTALHARDKTQKGQLVEVSAYQSAVLANYREPLTYEWTGKVGNRTGNLLIRGKSGVRQVWPCKDGFVTWALVDNPPMMRNMVQIIGEAAAELAHIDWEAILVADLDRATLESWESIFEAFFSQHTKAELGTLSGENGLGLSWIDMPDDVLASPHLAARQIWQNVEGKKLPGPLWNSSLGRANASRIVPALGEANAELLGTARIQETPNE